MYKKPTNTREIALFLISLGLILAWLLISLHASHLIGEENKYASIAWQMFQSHQWLVPKDGAVYYPDKPPLLFWLFILGWKVSLSFPWVRVIPTVFSGLVVFFSWRTAKHLFPESTFISLLAPLVLICMPFFSRYVALLRFDMLTTFFALLSCWALFHIKKNKTLGIALFAVANGLGLLTKGPVIYIFTLSTAIGYAYYLEPQHKKLIFKTMLIGFIGSLFIVSLWLIPAILKGGSEFANDIFFKQNIGRVLGKVGSSKSVFTYIPVVLAMLFPWLLNFAFYRNIKKNYQNKFSPSQKFLLFSILIPLIIFSFIAAKESRYILPLTPLIAIFLTSIISFGNQFENQQADLNFTKSNRVIGLLFLVIAGFTYFSFHYPIVPIEFYLLKYFSSWLVVSVAGFIGIGLIVKPKLSAFSETIVLLLSTITLVSAINFSYVVALGKSRNLAPMALKIKSLTNRNIPILSTLEISNWMQFEGRLDKPIPVRKSQEAISRWLVQHPQGWLLVSLNKHPHLIKYPQQCFYINYQRLGDTMLLCPNKFV